MSKHISLFSPSGKLFLPVNHPKTPVLGVGVGVGDRKFF